MTKCLLLSLYRFVDYLERWYGVYAWKAVYYHLDIAYERTIIDIGKWQKVKKKSAEKR